MKVIQVVKKYAIFVAFIALLVLFSIASPNFLTVTNFMSVARQASMSGVASVGILFVLLLGGIDMSIGSSVSLVCILCAMFMVDYSVHPLLASLSSLGIATLVGLINGFFVSSLGIPAFISSLAFMRILSGIAYLISGGMPIYGFSETFRLLGQGYVGFIPIPVIIMIICFLIGSFILNRTVFGRYIYAVGGNEEAAKLSGIRTGAVKYAVYALSGTFAGLAGLIMLARLGSGQASAGDGFEFEVITAAVLGGTSISGGYGKISGVIVGVLFMAFLNNGLVLMNVNTYVQKVIIGVVLVVAVSFDFLARRNNKK